MTQILLGASVAAVAVPERHRRAALLAGAALGSLPDLDALPLMVLTDDPVMRMTMHRAASHSLLVLPFVAWALWAWFRTRGGRVSESPVRWFWAIQLALITHPLLDAFTVYGTQLPWPLPVPPVMWSSVFIIDPAYTVWLLAGVAVAAFAGSRPVAHKALVLGLALSSAYLGWSLVAKAMVEREAERTLAQMGLADAPRFSVPMPLNTLLWRVVAMTPDGFVEGERSLVADRGPMRFRTHASETAALAQVREFDAVRQLLWFNHGFMKAQVEGDRLVLSDLRMGVEPDYTFSFVVAERDGDGWREISPEQRPWARPRREQLVAMWARIWDETHAEEAVDTGVDGHAR